MSEVDEDVRRLAGKLSIRLNEYLGEAVKHVVPIGSLGAGMGVSVDTPGEQVIYGDDGQSFTIIAPIAIRVYRHSGGE